MERNEPGGGYGGAGAETEREVGQQSHQTLLKLRRHPAGPALDASEAVEAPVSTDRAAGVKRGAGHRGTGGRGAGPSTRRAFVRRMMRGELKLCIQRHGGTTRVPMCVMPSRCRR